MDRKLPFRAWFYFRMGWSTYFAFIFAAINTTVVTYYLAIEKAPFLKEIFPSFLSYFGFVAAIGIPLLITIGYLHYKKSKAFSSETDITTESNPYFFKLAPGHVKDVQYPIFLQILNMLLKISNNQKFTEDDEKKISHLIKQLQILIDGGTVGTTKIF